MSLVDVREAITQAQHEEWARVVAALTKRFGDLDIAEEAAAEAFATGVERWPADGLPPNPGAWLTTTATRKAIDRIRRENKRDDKQKEARMLYDDDPPKPVGVIDDERLRLVFTCCHPALAMQTRVALTLRMVGGLTVPEIADIRDTDWSQVVALYNQLVRLDRSPIIALNRAIAVAELDGPEVALATVDHLEEKLAGYHAYHATRAALLRRLSRSQESRAAYDKAIELAGNTAETAYLTRRRDQLG